MRMLKYAILGLVSREPMSGYDIMKAFEGRMSKFWEARHSQIYPELSRLLDEKLVEYTVSIQGVKLEKKMYTITDAGLVDLRRWLCDTSPIEPVPKDCFRLKLYFGENLQRAQMAPVLMDQFAQHEERLALLRQRERELSDPLPSMRTDEFSEYLLVRGGVLRESAYLSWLHECADMLEIESPEASLSK